MTSTPGLSPGRPQLHAAVVGAGVAGLSTALGLARAGHRVTVFERDPQGARSQSNGGWHLWANAIRALGSLGVAEKAAAAGAQLEVTQYLTSGGGTLAEWDIGAIGRSVGARDIGVSRQRLHGVLSDALHEMVSAPPGRGAPRAGGVDLRYGCRVAALSEDPESVHLTTVDGDHLRVDLVVGADGIRSVVRAHVSRTGPVAPRFAGYTQCQALVPDRDPVTGRRWLPEGVEQVIFGRRCRVVLHHVGGGQLFWAGILYGAPGEHRDAHRSGTLLRRLADFPAPVAEVLRATPADASTAHDIYDLPPLQHWTTGRVVLVGDAAHAMTTNLSQGACLAIEDAVVLSDCVASAPTVAAALERYAARRMGRAQAVARRSRRVAALGGWRTAPACAVRDQLMRATLSTVALKEHRGFVAASL